jgi:hypothetical protein
MCSNLQLVFVHAEDDSTMPWNQTEELFRSTLSAATEATSAGDDSSKNHKVIDLGEAGRQEVWQAGSMRIQKTVAKHGGKRFRLPGFAPLQLVPRTSPKASQQLSPSPRTFTAATYVGDHQPCFL